MVGIVEEGLGEIAINFGTRVNALGGTVRCRAELRA
jgi:hypothetical protein